MPPLVSIIIPLFNQAKELVQCLESIKKQIFNDYEIIVVNDGSTDINHNTLCRDARPRVSTVKYIYQSHAGAPAGRNNGFKQAAGQYVIFCDADVIMKPAMLQKMVKILDANPAISYVYSSFKFGWKKFKLWEFDAEKLKQMPYIHTTSLIRRGTFPGWDENVKRLQDWDLWLTMLEKGYVGKWIDEVLFTTSSGGTMSSWLPAFWTKLGIGRKAEKYQQAVDIIKRKHKI